MEYPRFVQFDDPVEYSGFTITVGAHEPNPGSWKGIFRVFKNDEKKQGQEITTLFDSAIEAKEHAFCRAKEWADQEIAAGRA